MKHILRTAAGTILLALMIFASGFLPGALGMSAGAENVSPDDLTPVLLGTSAVEIAFSPTANGLYAVYLFPVGDETFAEAELLLGGEVVATGSGSLHLLSCRLTAGAQYTLRLTGEGEGLIEIARETLSRSFGMPLDPGERYSKLIARSGDVHWYAISSDAPAAALLCASPESEGLRLRTWLFSDDGRLLGQSEPLPSGAAALSHPLESGQTLYIRVAAMSGATGKYMLSTARDPNLTAADSIALPEKEISVEGRASAAVAATVSPASANGLFVLDSSDPEVLFVLPDGRLETRSAGTAVLTAYAYGGAQARCTVTVLPVAVEGVSLSHDAIEMTVGDEQTLGVTLIPDNALNRRLTFVTENDRVVTVDKRGRLTAVGEGTATIVAITEDGGFTDVTFVTVHPAPKTYRALLIGEQNYASTVDKVRPGSINSVASIGKLLSTAQFGDATSEITTLMDAPRDEVILGIRTTFADAGEGDVSLLYITCHGFYEAGMTFFVMADGSVLSARDLERELRKIPGEVILLADCCGSGGLLGEAGSTDDILDGIVSVFQGTTGAPAVTGSKYRVIASALLDQDSYRISFSDDSETGMATVFARALCDGAGWSIDRNARSSMNADANYDGDITLNELGTYMARRVNWYLNLAGGYVQNVRTYPEGDSFVLFSRPNS